MADLDGGPACARDPSVPREGTEPTVVGCVVCGRRFQAAAGAAPDEPAFCWECEARRLAAGGPRRGWIDDLVDLVGGAVPGPPRWPADPGRLDRFLATEELDDLVGWPYEVTTPDEFARIRAVVDAWGPRRALFNVLLNPQMLPPDAWWAPMHAVGGEHGDPWIVLAGLVAMAGFGQYVPDHAWAHWRLAVIRLLTHETDALLRNRATVVMAACARAIDRPVLAGLARDSRDARNLLVALLRVGADREALPILPGVYANGGFDAESRAWLARWLETGRRPGGAVPNLLTIPALARIPNLPSADPSPMRASE